MSDLAECPLCRGGRVSRAANNRICLCCNGAKTIPVAMAVEIELTGALYYDINRDLTSPSEQLAEIRKRHVA